MLNSYSRRIYFDSVGNFRDLGGYKAQGERATAWRRVFRSAELHGMTRNDLKRLQQEFELKSVIDLRSAYEIGSQGIGLLAESGLRYHNVSFITDGGNKQANEERYRDFADIGDFYFHLARNREFGKKLIAALEIIAEPSNQPLVFHCSAGKDRTGILSAILLSILGVAEEDIIEDYCLTAPYMKELLNRIKADAQLAKDARSLPDYFWKVTPRSISLFLTSIRQNYGSSREYLKGRGAQTSLFARLEMAVLT